MKEQAGWRGMDGAPNGRDVDYAGLRAKAEAVRSPLKWYSANRLTNDFKMPRRDANHIASVSPVTMLQICADHESDKASIAELVTTLETALAVASPGVSDSWVEAIRTLIHKHKAENH